MLVFGGLTAAARAQPQLALAGVLVMPALAGDLAEPSPEMPSTEESVADVNVLGVWTGNVNRAPWVVTIKRSAQGQLVALFEQSRAKQSWASTSVVQQGNHLRMTFYNAQARTPGENTVEGDVNPDFGIMEGVWSWTTSKGAGSAHFSLRQAPAPQPPVASAGPVQGPLASLPSSEQPAQNQPQVHAPAAPQAARGTPEVVSAGLEGAWTGSLSSEGKTVNGNITVTFTRSSDGLHATFDVGVPKWGAFSSAYVVLTGSHIKMAYFNDKVRFKNMNTQEGEVDFASGAIAGTWRWPEVRGGEKVCSFALHRGAALAEAASPQAAVTGLDTRTRLAPGSSAKLRLEEFSHALDVQLEDKLGASKLFNVIDSRTLSHAIQSAAAVAAPVDPSPKGSRTLAVAAVNAVPTVANRYGLPPQPDQPYDLRKVGTLSRFSNLGITFLLVTTLEDLDENHINGATVTREFESAGGRQTGWWVAGLAGHAGGGGTVIHSGSSSWSRQTVAVSPLMQKEQSLRVTLRSQLFDAKTGELLVSRNMTYARGRNYTASATANNELSMGDLYQTAAADLANWERTVVEDEAFPMKIVKVDDDGGLINRGSESGIHSNQYYDVLVLGAETKDPDTHEALGREEKNVGKVLIRDPQSQFSRAMISEDRGIKIGAVLRLHREP